MTTRASLLPGLPDRPDIVLAEGMGFRPGRVHEACGRSRRVLAAMLAGGIGGPVIWAQPAWERDRLYPPCLAAFCDPGRIVIARVRTPAEALWVLEESLRSGAVGLAVAELADPPALTPVRRLHLAAEGSGGRAMALLLTPDQGGAAGVESRWHMAPDPGGGWLVARLRARMAPPLRLRLVTGPDGRLRTQPAADGPDSASCAGAMVRPP
jgi:protein ImuA